MANYFRISGWTLPERGSKCSFGWIQVELYALYKIHYFLTHLHRSDEEKQRNYEISARRHQDARRHSSTGDSQWEFLESA
jgi:hypothetical protein